MVAGDFFTHEGGAGGKMKCTDYKRKVNMNMKRISARISALILALVLGVCVFVNNECSPFTVIKIIQHVEAPLIHFSEIISG